MLIGTPNPPPPPPPTPPVFVTMFSEDVANYGATDD